VCELNRSQTDTVYNSCLSLSGVSVYSDRKQTDIVSPLDPIQLLCLYGLREIKK